MSVTVKHEATGRTYEASSLRQARAMERKGWTIVNELVDVSSLCDSEPVYATGGIISDPEPVELGPDESIVTRDDLEFYERSMDRFADPSDDES